MTRTCSTGLLLVIAALSASAITHALDTAQPATITIVTDGTTSEVTASGGDVGYPAASQVDLEYDDLGIVVVSRVRLLAVFDEHLFVPMVSR